MTGVRVILLASLVSQLVTACASHRSAAPEIKPPIPAKDAPAVPRLVAAGVLKGDMASRSKVQSNLRIVKVASGQITIAFDGYRMPGDKGRPKYRVKASPSAVGGMVVPVTAVESYTIEGIVLRVADPEGKMPLPLKYLVEYDFSIEVTEVPAK